MRILSVDDSAVMRKIIGEHVSKLGAEFLQAGNGVQAMELLKSEGDGIDLVLLDWNMPEMNGIETLKAIKADDALKKIPVIMVTTEAEKKSVIEAVQAGAASYVVKPFEPEALLDKINKVLG